MGLEIDGAMQQAAQWGRQSMGGTMIGGVHQRNGSGGACHTCRPTAPRSAPTAAPLPAHPRLYPHRPMKFPQYNPELDNPDLNEAELDQLENLLNAVPSDSAMDVEGLDGYLTALLLAPELPSADDWVPRIWGGQAGEDPPFSSGKQAKRVAQLALRHLASIDRRLRADVETLEPFFGIAERDDADGTEGLDPDDPFWIDAGQWSAGFLLATELLPQYWEPLFDDPEWAELLAPLIQLGGEEVPEDLVQLDALSRQVPDLITALWEHRATVGAQQSEG